MPRFALVIVSLVVIASCQSDNLQSCKLPANVGMPGCVDAPMMMPSTSCTVLGCGSTPSTPVCDASKDGGTCVECTTSNSTRCTGTTPLCTNDVCTPCTNHADCSESKVCLPDGSCAVSADVAYVDGATGADNAPCTLAAPCTKLDKAVGLKAIVKVSGTVTQHASINSGTARIFADPGAKLAPTETDNSPALEIKGNAKLEIYDLQVSKAANSGASGLSVADTAAVILTRVQVRDNAANGIIVTGGQLTCTRCLVTSNGARGVDASGGVSVITQSTISNNPTGGIQMTTDAAFRIVSNVIFHNGQSSRAAAAGVAIQVNAKSASATPNQLDFNSISRNATFEGQGVQCSAGNIIIANSNIIYNNGDDPSTALQVSGSGCVYKYSDIGPIGVGTINANMTFDPKFVDEANGDLHLMSGSMAVRAADPNADLNDLASRDIDGELRVGPADIGADQRPRP